MDRTLAFFEGIEKLREKYKQFISTVEIKALDKDTWYIMFHFEYVDTKIGGIYQRVHLSTLGYGLLEGFEMALKQTQYRLRWKFAKSKKHIESMGLKRHAENLWTVKKGNSADVTWDTDVSLEAPDITLDGTTFKVRVNKSGLLEWKVED